MKAEPDGVSGLALKGDFSITGVSGQLPLLAEYLTRMAEMAPGRLGTVPPYEIDMTNIQTLDGCGCQLLAIFFRHLRRSGAGRLSLSLNREHRDKFHLFGFDSDIFAEECS